MLKEQIKSTEKVYKNLFVKLSDESKEVDKEFELIVSLIQAPHTTAPEKVVGDWGLKLVNAFDRLGDLYAKAELRRKDLHDKIEHYNAIFQLEKKMELEKENGGKRITDGMLEKLALADDDLYSLRIRYNAFEALLTHLQKKRETVWELIQLLKKTADVKTSFSQTLGEVP